MNCFLDCRTEARSECAQTEGQNGIAALAASRNIRGDTVMVANVARLCRKQDPCALDRKDLARAVIGEVSAIFKGKAFLAPRCPVWGARSGL